MGKISDYTRVLAAKLADVFVVDQTDNGTTETKSATVEQIGTAIGTLQNFADLDTSNKTLVDSINEIASYTPVYGNTASGAIATFDTSLALPLQDCTIAINAVQESGTPTPSSPKAISGFTGANIKVAGSNLWDEVYRNGYYNNSGAFVSQGSTVCNTNPIVVDGGMQLYIHSGTYHISLFFYDVNGNYLSNLYHKENTVITVPASAKTMNWTADYGEGSTYNNDISINYPATDTAYHAYNSTTTAITWQDEAGTVYGGGLRIANGYTKLVDNSNDIDLGTLTWTKNTSFANTLFVANITGKKTNNSNCLCTHYVNGGIATGATFLNNLANNNFASDTSNGIYIRDDSKASLSADDFKTAMSGVTLKYEVATPTEYTLASVPPIYTLNGKNNIFGDTNGDTSVVYACSLKDYIDSQ